MHDLRLSLGFASFENRNRFIIDGTIKPEGIEFSCSKISNPDELFRRVLNNGEFDVSELSLTSYIFARANGLKYAAIPVFPSRRFRHSDIWVNKKGGIDSPSDLNGKRIFSWPEYFVSAAIWQRGFLQHEYGLIPSSVKWFVANKERTPAFKFPNGVHPELTSIDCWQQLEAGKVDAVIGPSLPHDPSSQGIRRLFSDPKEAEIEYFTRTGIYPIMHTLVIKEELLREHRWIAKTLFTAFTESKNMWDHLVESNAYHRGGMAWIDLYVEEERRILGADPYKYGIEKNRKSIEAAIVYCSEQGSIEKVPTIEDLFPADYR